MTHLPPLAKLKGYQVDIVQDEVSPGTPLPKTWDDFLAGLSKKNRHELRRKLRRLGTVEGVSWYALASAEEVEGAMNDFLALLRLSKEAKYRFLTPEREAFFRSIARELGAMGLVRLFFMEIGGERVASALCFDYGSSRLLYNSGYNPQYGYYSVGLLLKAFAIKSAIEEGRAYFDFLRGNESYKYDLGGKDRPLYTMVVQKR
jgi:CelD/BcsL family acetyltransferase involved in cellulose biosynthesis